MDLAELRAAMDVHGAAWSALPRGGSRPGRRPRQTSTRRIRDPRPHQHPARAGAPPRDGSPEPDLHRPHDARCGTAAHRRLGLRLSRMAASSRSHPRPGGRRPATSPDGGRPGAGSREAMVAVRDARSPGSIAPHGSSTTSGSRSCSRRPGWSCRASGRRRPIGRRPKARGTGGRTWTGCGAGRMSSRAAGSPGTASSSAGGSRSCHRRCWRTSIRAPARPTTSGRRRSRPTPIASRASCCWTDRSRPPCSAKRSTWRGRAAPNGSARRSGSSPASSS